MKVFSFRYITKYGAGVELIAAETEEQARQISDQRWEYDGEDWPHYNGRWVCEGEVEGLTWSGEAGFIIGSMWEE